MLTIRRHDIIGLVVIVVGLFLQSKSTAKQEPSVRDSPIMLVGRDLNYKPSASAPI